MEKIFLFGFICLLFLSCESGVNLNLQVVMKTTSQVIKLEAGSLGDKTKVIVNHTWTWIQKPVGDSVVVERSLDSLAWSRVGMCQPITDEMTYTDADSTLPAGDTVWYRMSYFSADDKYYFISPRVILLPAQHFNQPGDFIDSTDNVLHIDIAPISGFNNYVVELYQGYFLQPESLMNMLNPIWRDSLVNATIDSLPMPDSLYPSGFYTLKVSCSKIVPLITDGTYGFRVFGKY